MLRTPELNIMSEHGLVVLVQYFNFCSHSKIKSKMANPGGKLRCLLARLLKHRGTENTETQRGVLVLLLLVIQFSNVVLAQKPSGGVSTGVPATYTTKRTVGITDPNGPTVFEDVTDKTAIAQFLHRSGTPAKDYIFETASGG